ncbi:Thiamine-monophosphate kinase [Candidatus Phaeomarinobacter ectocarpi]|uniref:Thiamine-monophosphate kinase n=1 Tax=Candidatus Phaeomarinibacter ectocarpi TaxID=1458461 RepID=X5MB87_9HYPH|nr:thiamine-phosphate kinase [Candidatus Phaeomarinobacter ectocarpi]CDO61343.1 Thiamine-monophosphate kinase [Candidatus Phaeomarinobacter ectocarpi]
MAQQDGNSETEFDLIARLFAPLSDSPHGLNLTDDVGLVPDTDGRSCITSDMIVAGVHFLADDPADQIAQKLVRVNISDLAAKGAQPVGCLLSAAFNQQRDISWLEAFANGLAEDMSAFGLVLIGGDTVRTPGPDTFSLTAIGRLGEGGMVTRAGAMAGDGLYVTGTIGDAGLGLRILRGELGAVALGTRTRLEGRYRLPQPRADFGRKLSGFASASLDVSDGLIADAGHLADASGLAARIDFDRVPLSSSATRVVKKDRSLHLSLLGAGDDYEILFAAPADAAEAIAEASGDTETPVTRIGDLAPGKAGEVSVVDGQGMALDVPKMGYRHF